MTNKQTDWVGLFALAASIIVWLQVGRSLFIRTHSEAMLFHVLSRAFDLAPIPFLTGLAWLVWKTIQGHRSAFSKIALLTSLPTVGVWLADRLPEMLGITGHTSELSVVLATCVVVFFIPTIFSIVAILAARKLALTRRSRGTLPLQAGSVPLS